MYDSIKLYPKKKEKKATKVYLSAFLESLQTTVLEFFLIGISDLLVNVILSLDCMKINLIW